MEPGTCFPQSFFHETDWITSLWFEEFQVREKKFSRGWKCNQWSIRWKHIVSMYVRYQPYMYLLYIHVCSLQFECKTFSVSDRVSISPYIIKCFTKSRFLKMQLIFLKLHKHNPFVLVHFRVSIIILYINYLFPKKKVSQKFLFSNFWLYFKRHNRPRNG